MAILKGGSGGVSGTPTVGLNAKGGSAGRTKWARQRFRPEFASKSHKFRTVSQPRNTGQTSPLGRIAGNMGRRPFVTVDTTPWYHAGQRLKPPTCLGEAERAIFIDLIGSVPAAQFQASDLPLICRWCELEVMAQTAADELRDSGMVTADGKKSPWVEIHAMATKGQAMLALRLRLGPQSRQPRAPKTQAAPMSYYERASLLGDDDDDEETAQQN